MGKFLKKVRAAVSAVGDWFYSFNLVDTIIAVFIGFVLLVGFLPFVIRSTRKGEPKATEAPVAPQGDVTSSFDWSIVLIAIVAGAVTFTIVKYAFPYFHRKIAAMRDRKIEARNNIDAWVSLRRRKDDLVLAWSQYETDIALMIDFPVMSDYTDPVVHKVIAAMQKIRVAETVDTSKTQARGSEYESAVNEFELAFIAAEKHARRFGQNHLSAQEQRKLATARIALDVIMSETSTGFEIEAAHKTLRSSLKGVIDVPHRAMASIEALIRKELVA